MLVTDTTIPALERLLVAMLVGFLVGLDRERAEARKDHALFAGVRTFPLIALAGAIPMLLEDRVGPALLVATFLAIAAVAVVSYVRTSAHGRIGATTEVAALATFLLGALAGAGQLVVAGAAGVALAVLLVGKPRLEAFSNALTTEEIRGALELAVITVIVLPLLPDRGYGPWQALNPREIWIVVVLVSALSFVGFVAMRVLGAGRGMAITGAVGGLVSSTAITISMAERSHTGAARPAAATAAVLASTIMCVRMAVLAGAVDPGILPRLLPILTVMAVAGGAAAWLMSRGTAGRTAAADGTLTNPFSLRAALTLAVGDRERGRAHGCARAPRWGDDRLVRARGGDRCGGDHQHAGQVRDRDRLRRGELPQPGRDRARRHVDPRRPRRARGARAVLEPACGRSPRRRAGRA